MDINNFNTQQHLDNSIIQMMAESYWEDYFFGTQSSYLTDLEKKNLFSLQLQYGNTTFRFDNPTQENLNSLTNTTRTSKILSEYAFDNFEIIDYKPNDITGLSCILVKNKETQEYTLAFRSTEYSSNLDPSSTDVSTDKEIDSIGYAVGQIASMENYYQTVLKDKLPINANLNISGYSLGGHLANAFYLMHQNEETLNIKMNVFNGTGVGVICMSKNIYNPYVAYSNFGTNIKNMADETFECC